ncbi:hypothetical protein CEXT_291781 [Caerostris extrusa]|uniref:Uncharacterized protein n=1 Tax=Caerostris extrusa TaxID=172846 RepID=A0AAV4YCE7_CAEEX|nr:hypothetical protein CEXT_291781 [Caerostris extrusa]
MASIRCEDPTVGSTHLKDVTSCLFLTVHKLSSLFSFLVVASAISKLFLPDSGLNGSMRRCILHVGIRGGFLPPQISQTKSRTYESNSLSSLNPFLEAEAAAQLIERCGRRVAVTTPIRNPEATNSNYCVPRSSADNWQGQEDFSSN